MPRDREPSITTRGPVSGSVPPPADNIATAAWYRAGKALDKVDALEQRMMLEFGQLAAKLRNLELQSRRSGHQIEDVKEWQENSQVRDLRNELAKANAMVEARRDARALWEKRVWALISAIVLLLVGTIIREMTRH